MIKRLFAVLLATLPAATALAQDIPSRLGSLAVTPVVQGLDTPWSFGFLPDGTILITERGGRLLAVTTEGVQRVAGVPEVAARGQGGLLDLLVPRDFAQSRELFLTYSKPQRGGAGTAVLKARLSADGTRLEDAETIFEMTPGSSGGRHFGSRLVEARDGSLFVTIGERGDRPSAQDLSRHNGSVVRIARDGSVPADNPFVGQAGAAPEIWSYGHRNPQGAALDGRGRLWVVEHGAQGGDEVNRIEKGANYGWPVISYGQHYSGAKIGEGNAKPGMEQPVFYWDPSIAPSGMVFLDGGAWEGDALVGSLKFNYIARLSGNPLREVEQLESEATLRVRDVDQGPDGALWFLSEINGTLYRAALP
ncbi:PQQ-dependent sugar dehydrogenase [Salipiger sp. P9]|uniref:PQQ-dependent sugar dehydrogenase n=1 Tax=Salipiger pentaromativorans TaxID=2943193 RepID=UPI0021572AF1|nr:PQQ-dependent sugar dehydrogenase [Salipiger pentaromativorans]MCR8547180.1 PQQ-dependent sugar dehydrogenase [Salipiger pentaromativorans]